MPYISARRVRGGLRETAREFGGELPAGVEVGDAKLRGHAALSGEVRAERLSPEAVAECFASRGGVAPGHVFECAVTFPAEFAGLVENAVKALTALGYDRNRGFGEVRCELREPGEPDYGGKFLRPEIEAREKRKVALRKTAEFVAGLVDTPSKAELVKRISYEIRAKFAAPMLTRGEFFRGEDGKPVLSGVTLAGALRSAVGEEDAGRLFGALRVFDAVVDGRVFDFDGEFEALERGAEFVLRLEVAVREGDVEVEGACERLVARLVGGEVCVGAWARRGFGRVTVISQFNTQTNRTLLLPLHIKT